MNKIYLTAFTVCLTVALRADVGINTNDLSAQLAATIDSGDLNRIVATLPEAEMLWPEKPKEYFMFMQRAAYNLNAACMTNANVKFPAWVVLTNVLSKPISTNYEIALDSLESQVDVVSGSQWVMAGSSHKKADLLLLAQFIGKISEQIITNYPNTEMILSGASQKDIEANKIANRKISWQMELAHNRRRLLTMLFLSYTDRNDDNLNEQLISAAHMSNAEAKELRSGARVPPHTASATIIH